MKKLIERSIKFDVADGFGFPDLDDLAPSGARWEQTDYEVDQTYYDTVDADLERAGIRLRRRTGGPKPGWQLRSPSRKVRAEIIDETDSIEVPALLAQACAGVARTPLVGVSTVTIKRQIHSLVGRDETPLIDIADDQVSGQTTDPSVPALNWHELEMKLRFVTNHRLSNKIGDRLVDAGARHSQWRSKLQRTTTEEPDAGPHAHTLGDHIGEYVATECENLLHADVGFRLGKFMVHETRVAIRRLSSALLVFHPVFDAERANWLLAELTWLTGELEALRDCDVVRRRLNIAARQIADDFVLGPVGDDIDSTLRAERSRLLEDFAQVLDSDRYRALAAEIQVWQSTPPMTRHAQQKVHAGRHYVRDAEEKALAQLRKARGLGRLQEACDAARRLRHATELMEHIGGDKVIRTLRATNELQILLAEYRDSLAAADFLLRMGRGADANPSRNGFTFGLLTAQERERADHVRFELSKRWV